MIKVYNTNYSQLNHGIISDNCIKFYEGKFEISIATEDSCKSDIRIYNRNINNMPNETVDYTDRFFKSEIKKFGYVVFSNDNLIKAIRLARKLSKE